MRGTKTSLALVFRTAPPQMVAPCLVAAFLTVVFGSNTGISLLGAAVFAVGLIAWALLWFSQMLRIHGMGVGSGLRDHHPAAVAFRIVFEPVLAMLLVLLLWSHQLTRFRLELSSDAVDRFAENVLQGGILAADAETERQLGLFQVRKVHVSNGKVKLFTCPDGLSGPSGLLYSPRSKPENIGEDTFTHLSGPWYAWKQTW